MQMKKRWELVPGDITEYPNGTIAIVTESRFERDGQIDILRRSDRKSYPIWCEGGDMPYHGNVFDSLMSVPVKTIPDESPRWMGLVILGYRFIIDLKSQQVSTLVSEEGNRWTVVPALKQEEGVIIKFLSNGIAPEEIAVRTAAPFTVRRLIKESEESKKWTSCDYEMSTMPYGSDVFMYDAEKKRVSLIKKN